VPVRGTTNTAYRRLPVGLGRRSSGMDADFSRDVSHLRGYRRICEPEIVVVPGPNWHLWPLNDCQARYRGQWPRVPRDMGEQLFLAEEHSGVTFLDRSAKLDAE